MKLALATLKSSLSALTKVSTWPSRGKGYRPGIVWSPDGARLCIAACEGKSTGHVHELDVLEESEPFSTVALNLAAWDKMCTQTPGNVVLARPLYGQQKGLVLGIGLLFSTEGKTKKKAKAPQETKLLSDNMAWTRRVDGDLDESLPPVLTTTGVECTTIDLARWVPAIKVVLPAMSDDFRRPVVHRVLARGGRLMASDGHRTAIAHVGQAPELIIPPELASMISRLPAKGHAMLGRGSQVDGEDMLVFSYSGDGVRRRLMVKEPTGASARVYEVTTDGLWQARHGTCFSCSSFELRQALVQAKVVADGLLGVAMRISPDTLHIQAGHADTASLGLFETMIDAKVADGYASDWFRLRRSYLEDAIDQLGSERIAFYVSTKSENDPVVLRGNRRIVAIMPVRMHPHERPATYSAWEHYEQRLAAQTAKEAAKCPQ